MDDKEEPMITGQDLQTPESGLGLSDRSRGPKRGGRRPEPRIVDPATHPRDSVCLSVAADYLGLDHRTVLARIEDRKLKAVRDGKVYRIAVSDLVSYRAKLR